ncbi:hypothetical protein CEXT_762751 [Caerostris extrusa]|uniref:Uncharacterized protein n=1 Tax=Caerostris extrusa TaxID=172846 RepID=A0AAV4WZ92_CAEEX|nr:hypothetical protein CEXT_762751 [Caerostris extrusa]
MLIHPVNETRNAPNFENPLTKVENYDASTLSTENANKDSINIGPISQHLFPNNSHFATALINSGSFKAFLLEPRWACFDANSVKVSRKTDHL